MSILKDTIQEAKCEDLHCVVDNGDSKYLCFTRVDIDSRLPSDTESFIICTTDSLDLWKLEITYGELNILTDISNMNMENFLSKLR